MSSDSSWRQSTSTTCTATNSPLPSLASWQPRWFTISSVGPPLRPSTALRNGVRTFRSDMPAKGTPLLLRRLRIGFVFLSPVRHVHHDRVRPADQRLTQPLGGLV